MKIKKKDLKRLKKEFALYPLMTHCSYAMLRAADCELLHNLIEQELKRRKKKTKLIQMPAHAFKIEFWTSEGYFEGTVFKVEDKCESED